MVFSDRIERALDLAHEPAAVWQAKRLRKDSVAGSAAAPRLAFGLAVWPGPFIWRELVEYLDARVA